MASLRLTGRDSRSVVMGIRSLYIQSYLIADAPTLTTQREAHFAALPLRGMLANMSSEQRYPFERSADLCNLVHFQNFPSTNLRWLAILECGSMDSVDSLAIRTQIHISGRPPADQSAEPIDTDTLTLTPTNPNHTPRMPIRPWYRIKVGTPVRAAAPARHPSSPSPELLPRHRVACVVVKT